MHSGHKQRLRQKALKDITALQPHEIIEVLLSFSIVRQNTNPTAHLLIDKFGDISKVIDADIEELVTVNGVGYPSATLLKNIPIFAQTYIDSKNLQKGLVKCPAIAKEYFKTMFNDKGLKGIYALCLDEYDKIIASFHLSYMSSIHNFSIPEATKQLIIHNTKKVFLAQSFNEKITHIAQWDMVKFEKLEYDLECHNIKFLDCFYFNGTIKNMNSLLEKSSPKDDYYE